MPKEGAANILFNSILLPRLDSLVGNNPLPGNPVAREIGAFNESHSSVENLESTFTVKFKGKDSNNTSIEKEMKGIQQISGLSMTRENEQRHSGGTGNYVVNLPGNVSYGDVTISHLYTKDKYFLDWIMAGNSLGGCPRVNIVIEIHTKISTDPYMIFTLEDAFPTAWELSDLAVAADDKSSTVLETLTFTYSRIAFSLSNDSSSSS